jgi:hypothetical protein
MTTYERVKRHEAEKKASRFTTMSIVGNREDGSDTQWFVMDRQTFRSGKVFGTMEEASAHARTLNAKAKTEYLARVK